MICQDGILPIVIELCRLQIIPEFLHAQDD